MSDNIIFNVKNAEGILEAVTNLLIGGIVAHSPQCVTRSKPWGHSIKAQRTFRDFVQDARKECATPDYQEYKQKAEKYTKYFTYQQRRGYGVLTFNYKAVQPIEGVKL